MKWLLVCLAVFFMVAPAMAGEDAYIAIVGNDYTANSFYFSPKYQQFLYDQTVFAVPLCFTKPGVPVSCESFKAQTPVIQPELCETGRW